MKEKLVVLFYPKADRENIMKNLPLGILKVGSELKSIGYEVMAIDERFEENYENRLRKALDKAICFGVSVMTGYQIRGALKSSSFVKRVKKDLPVVWGGWHPSILSEETLKSLNIDIVVRGQGERTACELTHALENNVELKDISGISYKENGTIKSNPPREFQDINTFHSPRFDVLEFERYIFKSPSAERTIFWSTSQGCPYQCGFCSTPTVYCRKWSGLKVNRLLEQLKALIDNYNIDGFTFVDDNLFVDIKRVEDFCQRLIENKLKIKWGADVRVDQINNFSDSFIYLLKKSGCFRLYIGAESGDQDVLDLIDKGINIEDTYKTAEKLSKYNIISEFYIMFGFPDNPKEDLKNSLTLIKRIKTNFPNQEFTPFVFTPYPGTPLFDFAVKKGLKAPQTLEDWVNWGLTSINTPWVDRKYLDNINMFTKCFYPLAFPSSSLKVKFKKRFLGFPYRLLHKMAKLRMKINFFLFPFEWRFVELFYKIKIRFNLFKSFESFR